ncbi:MAG: hypothetical protein V4603_06750 [Pseudomonadota bacterium]
MIHEEVDNENNKENRLLAINGSSRNPALAYIPVPTAQLAVEKVASFFQLDFFFLINGSKEDK